MTSVALSEFCQKGHLNSAVAARNDVALATAMSSHGIGSGSPGKINK